MIVPVEIYVHWVKYDWQEEPRYEAFHCDMTGTSPDYALICKQVVSVEIPDDFDPNPSRIAALKKEKESILAKAQVQANNIEEQIQRILCIEYKADAK